MPHAMPICKQECIDQPEGCDSYLIHVRLTCLCSMCVTTVMIGVWMVFRSLSTYQPSRILWYAGAYLRQQWSFCADVVDLQIVESIVRSLCEIVMCNSAARALKKHRSQAINEKGIPELLNIVRFLDMPAPQSHKAPIKCGCPT
ncbi:hypothetical protein D917_10558 [Trichinella nativa]|uniref:Uncharacterized protein n=1 Tax=Trichinella nativa TaxID=6335 RepID=A0A1Y3EB92_9BILA|nr:hypothetical protein D917_10558 [Trichinella nativa]